MNNTPQIPIPRDQIEKILVIRRNRMGDMICTLPLLRALRKNFPQANIKVACDELGAPIARACDAVNEVVVLKKGINRLHTPLRNRRALRGCDLAIGVKAGFDRMLAALVRISGAPHRIGFAPDAKSIFYTHPLSLPPFSEHQIESCLRLLAPLDIANAPVDLRLDLPAGANAFASRVAQENQFAARKFIAVFNLSWKETQVWPLENFVELGRRILRDRRSLLGLSCLPKDRALAEQLAARLGSTAVFILQTPDVLELAAVLKKIHLLVTHEGGAAHLAAAMNTPAIVLWQPGGTFEKWHSRSIRHQHLHADKSLAEISTTEVWSLIQRKILPAP